MTGVQESRVRLRRAPPQLWDWGLAPGNFLKFDVYLNQISGIFLTKIASYCHTNFILLKLEGRCYPVAELSDDSMTYVTLMNRGVLLRVSRVSGVGVLV